jgi:hypothetical protein
VGAGLKGDCLTVADVNGDGRPDFLFSTGTGILVLNTPQGFVEAKNSGIQFQPGGVTPAFGDFDGDGKPDLVVPQRASCLLFHNEGSGRFTDVTAQSGDLAKPLRDARCAGWIQYGAKGGRADLFVGCLKGPNQYFHNNGKGAFFDATEMIGLGQRVFCTRAIAVVDLNNDKLPDVVLNNEGQDSEALLTSATWPGELAKLDSPAKGAVALGSTDTASVPESKEAIVQPSPPDAAMADPKPRIPRDNKEETEKTGPIEKTVKSGIVEAAPKPAWQRETEPEKTTRLVPAESADSTMTPEQRQTLVLGIIVVVVVLVVVLYIARPRAG